METPNGPASSRDSLLAPARTFADRHIGPSPDELERMLEAVGVASLDALIDQAVPSAIRLRQPLELPPPISEYALIETLRTIAGQNIVCRSMIGMGYADTITPPVILRNVLENPGWYTQYTPYQAEISQGRLEALINFQTMVTDLTGLPLANASLLDEATAAAEAMTMCRRIHSEERNAFVVAPDCHPQTIRVIQTRATPLGIRVIVADPSSIDYSSESVFGVLVQYPATDGVVRDLTPVVTRAHAAGALVVCAADLLALTLFKPPGEFGVDIAVGSAQRFGVPMGFGGPHAAYMSTREEYARQMPGRLIGVSRDADGNAAYRLSVQTREQHIRRDKATSNICTAQVLLAIMAGMYAAYHGPEGLRRIAARVRALTLVLRRALAEAGAHVAEGEVFDTLRARPASASTKEVLRRASEARINLRDFGDGSLGISLDETTTLDDLRSVCGAFGSDAADPLADPSEKDTAEVAAQSELSRQSTYLTHPVFNSHHSEHEMLRYLHRLQSRDLSLTTSMIPLGSCTMKLNATTQMIPVTWPEFGRIHPYAPEPQTRGYALLCRQLSAWLAEITGFTAVSLQPNSGASGEYAGLLAIRAFHHANGQNIRNVCLIPTSAHGTNPASAVMAGMRVVPVACDAKGNIDLADLRKRAEESRDELAALMITYPSTHGVFETTIREICSIVHEHGGQVYMDGANMNAQCGVCRPADMGADVCHLNLHKTFCIPHGGGGPGMGPIAVAPHLAAFLPGNPLGEDDGGVGPVSAAPLGSASILPISWAYIAMMGEAGLRKATQVAILNANYMAARLREHYPLLYAGPSGRVAHEFILDLRSFKKSAGIEPDDVAKRLMDYGFHAPTMSWPVPGTLMIEPTESESQAELDRFCDAMIAIRAEIREIEEGRIDHANNPLKNAPHTAAVVCADVWERPYSREKAAYPAPWLRDHKYWPPVSRIDNVYGDRNLFCSCVPVG